jgi:NTP pyrophosphatase (non-canonical NTP hydrolase)
MVEYCEHSYPINSECPACVLKYRTEEVAKLTEYINSHLTFDRLREINVERCNKVFHNINEWTPGDWAVAMVGECGEVCNAVKKLRRLQYGKNTAKDPQTPEEAVKAIAKELADTVIYADLLAARLGIDLGQAVRAKFNEVSMRYNSKITL